MEHAFQITGLDKQLFIDMMYANESRLKHIGAHWLVADQSPGYPCRVSLQDAAVGERVLACQFEHHPATSAYRASGPIFVREQAVQRLCGVGEIPAMLLHRELSFRAYDMKQMMVAAQVTCGLNTAKVIQGMLAKKAVQYIHIHNAGPGCFNCAVQRVE